MENPASGSKPSQEGLTCLYPSKRCDNPRGVKRNGEPHNFCEIHRNKANFNQRRLEHKRKYQQEAPPQAQHPDNNNAVASPSTTLEPDDIWILQELLNVENASDENVGSAN
ncbi:hypothetical protein JG688_00003152 [Phytophthora aleatoria]|uniref:Uncharacterized protein n=1 Tax=Phytophthora aleatoria TaxID=2496075 RepID=A0A8J5M872_9STRA|nr:hypothetical protein GQ600_27025 [Phytophthora cactorum]KAG6974257.1 hypothetical protein JG688_00003152 [Phytophthora aleatoria]